MSTTKEDVKEKARDSTWLERLARFGLISRGVVYVLVGFLSARIATRDAGPEASREGAFGALAKEPLGKWLLVACAIGFAGYAVWRLAQAALDPADESDDTKAKWAKRLAWAGRGLFYGYLCGSTIKTVITTQSESQDQRAQSLATRLMSLPGGVIVVGGFGVALMVVGVVNIWTSLSGRHEKELKTQEMSEKERGIVALVARYGLLARGTVFALVGGFFLLAALQFDPDDATGLDGTLHEVATRSYGPWALWALAIGLFAFGLYSVAQARYREVLGS